MARLHFPNTRFLVMALTLFVLTGSRPVHAEMAGGCHCFKNRSYNPEDRFGVDDYLRATAVNSLVARFFHVSKKDIVMMRMNGAPLEELLAAFYISRRGEIDYREILDLRFKHIPWPEVLTQTGLKPETIEPGFADVLARGDTRVMEHLEDATLARFFSIEPAEVIQLRTLGLENVRDRVLALGLARRLNVPAGDLARSLRQENRSWGEMAAEAGLTPEHMGPYIESISRS
ncbi:MAG: hypothetical protein ACWGSD_21025 [Thermodesulfobacteriota bacterium]